VLPSQHLIPLDRKADSLGLMAFLPYLQKPFVDYATQIPLAERTSRKESKMPLRRIAEKLGVPEIALKRDKTGFVDALNPKAKLFRT